MSDERDRRDFDEGLEYGQSQVGCRVRDLGLIDRRLVAALSDAYAAGLRAERARWSGVEEALAEASRHLGFLKTAADIYREADKSHIAWRKILPAIDAALDALRKRRG